MSEGAWQPLLTGDVADEARTAARAIAESLLVAEVEPYDAGHVALFWAYAAGIWDDAPIQDAYSAAVERLVDRVSGAYELRTLFGGLAGDGWVFCHISDDTDALAVFDDALVELLAPDGWTAPYDLIEGLVGYGVYFCERVANAPTGTPADVARAGLARVVHHLHALHSHHAGGVAWLTPQHQIPIPNQPFAPAGYYNCGVAHGIAGVVPLLAKVVELGDPPPRTQHMLDDATAWLWNHQLPRAPRGRFPSWVLPERSPMPPTRSAWCYGDPGLACALWSAAARTGGSTERAHALMREVAAREPEHTGIVDSGLCHGTSGMAHLLNRCYQASGDPLLRDAAIAWFRRTLTRREPGKGIGGFLSPPIDAGSGPWRAAHALLEGGTGIGLSLIAACTDSEPRWDRLLLCDVPLREAT